MDDVSGQEVDVVVSQRHTGELHSLPVKLVEFPLVQPRECLKKKQLVRTKYKSEFKVT